MTAERALRADDWPSLLTVRDELRERDTEWWPHLWAPCVAIAVEKTGGDGWPVLVAAVDAGFRQVEMLPLADVFASHAGWAELCDRVTQPAPPDRWTLRAWPTVAYGPPLVLDSIAQDRLDGFRRRLPNPQGTSWETATQMLEWTTTRWEHANDHVNDGDALDVLDGVAAGRRFACVEYSIVLSQALNAVGIPARRMSLRSRDSHVGFGRGHVVTEAWIDGLGKWVVLDGQNGAWWETASEPLGYAELHDLYVAGGGRATMVTTARELSSQDEDQWWSYFDSAISSGMAWSRPYVATFQGEPAPARLLVSPDANVHPDLSELETSIVDLPAGPGVAFTPIHPYAEAVRVDDRDLAIGQPVALADAMPGTTAKVEVAAVTPYGPLAPHTLTR